MKLEWKTCFKIGVTVALLFLFFNYWDKLVVVAGLALSAAKPLIVGCVIAYVVNILMSFYERYYFTKGKIKDKKWVSASKRIVCMLLAYLSVVGILFLVFSLVVPQLIECGKLLVKEIPVVLDKATVYVQNNKQLMNLLSEAGISIQKNSISDWEDILKNALTWIASGIGGVMGSVFSVISGVFSGAVTLLIGVIFSIYLLISKETLFAQVRRIFKTYCQEKAYKKISYVYHTFHDCFHRFIVGQCTEAVILGLLCMVCMWIFRFPYATMIGAFIGFTALIPVAGAYIGAAVGAFMILTVSPIKALLFLVFIVVLQQLEGNLVYPRVVGSSIGLPGIWVLSAVTIGGGVLGVGGMLLGVPIAAACYQMLRADVRKRNIA
ncbi:MAG: AI-2E family transporter [Lachnospiraceae bacterium]|nr:AI-2E family transporter [Lachnospiraceae bacterium]